MDLQNNLEVEKSRIEEELCSKDRTIKRLRKENKVLQKQTGDTNKSKLDNIQHLGDTIDKDDLDSYSDSNDSGVPEDSTCDKIKTNVDKEPKKVVCYLTCYL